MSTFTGTRIDLSAAFYSAQCTYTNAFNHDRVAQGFPSPTPSFGFVQGVGTPDPGDGPDAAPPLAFGISLVPVAGGTSRADFRTALFQGGERESSRLAVLGLSAGLSFRIHPRISVGAALTGLYASLDQEGLAGGSGQQSAGFVRNFAGGQIDAADPFFLVNGQKTTWGTVLDTARAPNTFSSSRVAVQGAKGFGVSGTFGVLFQVLDELSVGAAYRTPGFLTPLEGDARLDASTATGAGAGGLNSIQANFLANHLPDGGSALGSRFKARLSGLRMPETAGVGFAFWPHPRILLALDLKWIDWKRAFDTIRVDLRNGSSRDLAEITSNQQSRSVRSTVLYRWHEQEVIGAGAAFALTDWLRLRLGYNFGTDPVPTRTENPFNAATVEHHGTVGFGLAFSPFSFDFAWVHAFPKSTTIERNAAKPDFNGTRHKTDQDAFLFGTALEF